MLSYQIIILTLLFLAYYIFIFLVLKKNKKKKTEKVANLHLDSNFVLKSSHDNNESILSQIDDNCEHNKLLEQFKNSSEDENINPLILNKNEKFKIIRNKSKNEGD